MSEETKENTEKVDTDEVPTKSGMTENEIVVIILLVTAVFLVIVGVYVWMNRKYFGFAEMKYV
jgi:cytoskeletal protein RodZ